MPLFKRNTTPAMLKRFSGREITPARSLGVSLAYSAADTVWTPVKIVSSAETLKSLGFLIST